MSQFTVKIYNKTYVTSNDSDGPVHPPSMARVLVHPSLDSPEDRSINEDSDQTFRMRRLIWVFIGSTSLIVSFVVRWLK